MKALNRLQSSIMFQAVENESLANKLSVRAKMFVSFGVLVAAAMVSQGAKADDGPMNPSNCAGVGATVGGLVGSAVGNTNVKHAIGAALGALAGGAAGHFLCSPSPGPSRDSSYNMAANYGTNGQSVGVDPHNPKAPLSINERDYLDNLSRAAIDAKYEWKHSLWNIDQAKSSNFAAGFESAMEQEATARRTFEQKREAFATVVAKFNVGADGTAPRAVGRYIEISASLLSLDTKTRVSYQSLEARDQAAQQQSPAYHAEADRAAKMRNNG